ncbi:TIR domain-containing protein [Elizabethkingia anophelis]|uniref:TIR domain-containing protein n=1 Tax=Elizabethkingia anophelis TaxID=1117645 RepID=UPI0004E356A0|nr:nucleotide-binding protein [Elizabethkingia anophelis]KFC33468.1 hypothetical protein FF18_08690 [Elizabethkingia anophelis]PKR29632.1 hypothetical protein CWH99_02010 [Elizabethkingia anophelis]PKR35227.1 hypothetical protein CWI00_11290 [Elizabethkingia anophelis]PRQ81275.1 hypothetical protein CMT60_04225 [Elizabethkingia anophelis]PRQ82348.1 hypothetical protein CMT87_16420 [Elizabethkingia anophelis]
MAKRTTLNSSKQSDALIISKLDFISKLQERIKIGIEILNRPITNIDQLDKIEIDYSKWDDYNVEFLKNSFNNENNEYKERFIGVDAKFIYTGNNNPDKRLKELKDDTQNKITYLETLIDKTELIKSEIETSDSLVSNQAQNSPVNKNDVFIVHGHNNDILQSVARTIEKLGLNPIILHEKANAGKTIIEKFETHTNVGFAVILLTDDDEGKAKTEIELKKRARQNVVLELGYLMCKLGRSHILPLYSEGVELPSDIHGLLYVPIDKASSWKFALAKELKEAGYNIDANKLM